MRGKIQEGKGFFEEKDKMTSGTMLNIETDVVDCPSTTEPTRIATLRPGQSITIKSLASSGKFHYIGSQINAKLKKGYKLATKESMSISLPKLSDEEVFLELWALPETAGADVTYFMGFDIFPQTASSGG